ncbi:TPA: YSIRK-type signal peptide-containing protein, partial [Streptococcus pyogenes]|nr:YSIRK-type signal peptide-containing protein [Streptococcus pyogenes]
MVRKDTNRHYSLRKLKTGTVSVAVALTVVGAGLVSQTEVSAAITRATRNDNKKLNKLVDEYEVKNHSLTIKNEELKNKNEELTKNLIKAEEELGQNDRLLSEKTSKIEELKTAKAQVEEKLKA